MTTSLPPERLKDLYRTMLLNRLLEERLSNLYRQGKVVGGLYRSLGQEATSVATAFALEPGDLLAPLIRNLGSVLARGIPARDVLTQYLARGTSPSWNDSFLYRPTFYRKADGNFDVFYGGVHRCLGPGDLTFGVDCSTVGHGTTGYLWHIARTTLTWPGL